MQNKRIGLKQKNKIRRMSLVVGFFLFLFLSLVLASHHPKMIIDDVSLEGNSAITDREITSVINKELTGKYFRVFPKNNIFLYSKNRIKTSILDTFKRVYFTDVKMRDLKSISVEVKERKPYVLWCEKINEEQEIDNPSECYFLDNKGFAFTKAPIFSDDVYFIVFGKLLPKENDTASTTSKLGHTFLGEEKFLKLMNLRDIFAKEGLETTRLRFIDGSDFEFYLNSGGKLIFNENQNMEKLFNNLTSAIQAKSNDDGENNSNKVSSSSYLENIDYVDLRFNNKVLFKFLDKK